MPGTVSIPGAVPGFILWSLAPMTPFAFCTRMRLCLLVHLVLMVPASGWSQSVTSPYLANPDLAIGYVDSCARFWMQAYDPVQGGFYMNIDRTGKLIGAWGTGKNTLIQSRDAYGFLRAYMLTGKKEYLTHARRALDFLYRSGWDAVHGGWYEGISAAGVPTSPSAKKLAYIQHYAMLGITASVEVTDDSLDRAILDRSLAYMENRFWDARPGSLGYFDHTLADGSMPYGKSFNATVDAVTTHMLGVYLLKGSASHAQRLQDLADNMVDRLAASAATQAIGFVEGYDTDWNPDPGNTMTIMGHVLKTAWCLARIHPLFPNSAHLAVAEQLAQSVLMQGYDHEHGGPYKDYDRTTGQMLMWGQADTAKAWWQMEQAVTAGLLLYAITGDEIYLEMADRTLNFFMTHFVDHTYGEVYENRTKHGGQIWDTNKGSGSKAAYHSTELGYYIYLYGNLLVKHTTATLHYAFAPMSVVRSIRVAPISFPTTIAAVKLDGQQYNSWTAATSTVQIPAGVGGDFAITFQRSTTGVGAGHRADVPDRVRMDQNYPNPFNPATIIRFAVPHESRAVIRVYDVLGREVATVLNAVVTAGEHVVRFDGSGLSSGVYLYRLEAEGVHVTHTMLLTK